MSRPTRFASTTLAALAALALAGLGACGGDDDGNGTPDAAELPDAPPPADAAPPDSMPLPPDAKPNNCNGVGTRCADSTHLEECVNGNVVATDCAETSQTCQQNGSGGFQCVDAPTTGANTVTGKVEYQDREPQPSGALGSVRTLPARGVSVSIVAEQGGAVLVTGRTLDDGTYSLSYDADPGTMVHVLAATTSDLASRPVKCVKTNGSVHGLASAPFATAATVTQNLLATEASGTAEAFNVFDQMVIGIDAVRVRIEVPTASLQPIIGRWQKGSTDGTYYDGSLHLLGASDDDDGYDDAVILHEFGHYVEAVYGGTDSPGGSHGGQPVDPRLGWSEGFSTYFSSAARANPFYMDSNSGGGFGDDLEHTVVKGQATGPMTQNMSEETVAEVLWDIGDGQANDDDPRAPGDRHEDVLKVQTLVLHTSSGPRGVAGIDLVDWLDGWFKLQGTSTCGAARNIVVTTHTFPYDFNAPGAACP